MNQDKLICSRNTEIITDTLESLGFVLNREKSVLKPCQQILFFGFILDSVEFKVYLTERKIQKILLKAKILLSEGVVVIRDLASFIGLIVNAFYAVFEAKLHFRDLERNKIKGLEGSMDFDKKVQLSDSSILELKWWHNNVETKHGKLIRPMPVHVICRTDASFLGYGGIDLSSEMHTNGRWTSEAINYLELLAIFYALQALYYDVNNTHIEIQSDNTTAVSYISEFGGMASSDMDVLAKSIWMWCIERNIHLSATHIPGKSNTADYYSRNFSSSTEWMLKMDIFERICLHFFRPDINLFASRLNKRVNKFVSWFPEPGASFTDAFSVSWQNMSPYVFPPFNIVGKVINKIIQDKVDECIIIFPFWCAQSWFTMILENMCSFPATKTPGPIDISPQQRGTSFREEASTHRSNSIREALQGRGLSGELADFIIKSWSTGTRKQYQHAWRHWGIWNDIRCSSAFQTSETVVLTYLFYLHKSGKSYSVINTHKAMLLCTLPFFGNSWCKNTDFIPRFMRSVFISKPPKPRYIAMWDVSIVLRFLESLGKNSDLSLKILTFKTVALVSLAIAPRAQTLISLCLNNMIVEKDAIVFMISDILKTTAHGDSFSVRIEHFRNESLCAMHTLLDYIEATKKVRLSNSLFISYVTFKKVTTSTIARWLKLTLSLAGIDTAVFKAHSFRGAATSAAFNRGCSLKPILKTANWKSDKNFRKFYYRQCLRKQDISFSNALFTL
ncbi:LOW QUALITY PROTEIN: hypothetical protein MAR_001848 [Mya arenaria]|uniref:Tyr recombinase domain-containing protein n=1 Tax=Mya arenaria TaxID=6604 RepID=A0ABY7FD42_MYAAR|nr:LOW QUALITY PROTEIN: hypothetical protein MAR_001848 [Mya arenaria]